MKDKSLNAVALKYPENADVPFITAKGRGNLAQKIIEVAKKNNVPIEKNIEVVNILSAQEIGNCIPEETWEVLAIIFSSVMERK